MIKMIEIEAVIQQLYPRASA